MSAAQNIGKSLIRAKKKRQLVNRANFEAILQQEERHRQSQSTEPALKSVWQTTDLADVLAAADSRLEGYTANRDIRVVVGGAVHVVTGDKLVPDIDAATEDRDWFAESAKLPIPERPPWNFKMSANELDAQEKASFVEWRRSLGLIEDRAKIVMTPYEKNVEVWRQLWRVVEKSDVVLEIVDARNPLAFRSEGMERYVAKHKTKAGTAKQCLLLLNKADLLTATQRRHWAEYFTRIGLRFFFFSAKISTESSKPLVHADDTTNEKLSDDEEEHVPSAASPADPAASDRIKKIRRRKDRRTAGAPTIHANPFAIPLPREEAERRKQERDTEKNREIPATATETERDDRVATQTNKPLPWDILDPTTLLDVLACLREELGVVHNEPIVVGMTGYPNVGKSSTINSIMVSKRVVVSATPGKTKHFQTLPIPNERRIILCDCPGLVFPSFASTKEAMICDGVLPIDTCRNYIGASAIVCRRIPKMVLEKHYLVVLDKAVDIDESASYAELLLNQLARRKGFLTEHDKPNRYRSAQVVLRDYVEGKLLYVHPPPGLSLQPVSEAPGKETDDAQPSGADGEDWETEDDAEWEDMSEANDARQLSDGRDTSSSTEENDLSFWAMDRPTQHRRPLTTAELFNSEINTSILTVINAKWGSQRRRKKSAALEQPVDDNLPGAYHVNKDGQKELLVDDDDDIVICGQVQPREKRLSKRKQRRAAKYGLLELRGAKPAAPHQLYALSSTPVVGESKAHP